MVDRLVEFSACLIESIICTSFIIRYFSFKTNNHKYLKLLTFFLGSMLVEIEVTYTSIKEQYGVIFFVAIFSLLSIIFLNGKVLEKILVSCLIYFIVIAINMTVLTALSSLMTEKYSNVISQTGLIRVFVIAITKILMIFVLELILRYKNKRSELVLNRTECITVIITFIITASVGLALRDILKHDMQFPDLFVYIAGCMVVLNIIVFSFMLKISQTNQKDIEMQLLKFQLLQQENCMRETDKRYEETTKIRHDMKNYVSCALSLAENNEYDELKNYLRSFSSMKLGKIQHYVTTESRVLNAVLNSKLTFAEENSIAIDCVITAELKKINEIDISILLSNLLDNAIEACQKNAIPSKLKLEIDNYGPFLRIRITNTYDVNTLGKNPSLHTTKDDKINHGLGLKSVNDIVHKYSGSIKFAQNDNEFTVSVIIVNS